MKICISGSSGFIGSAIRDHLSASGFSFARLQRRAPGMPPLIYWEPERGRIEQDRLEGMDAVIHLAGENIAWRWSAKHKEKVLNSRVKGTKLLCESIAALRNPPPVFLCASAVGFYGNRGSEVLDESSAGGDGFLAEVCEAWEEAIEPLWSTRTRVVSLRFGMVLGRNGGALRKMYFPFLAGLGGKLGDGQQYMSWISIQDTVRAISHCLTTASVRGAVNVVSPNPVTNEEFTKSLAKLLNRPTLLNLPVQVLRALFGQMADELLLASIRVRPDKLLSAGFTFAHKTIGEALRANI